MFKLASGANVEMSIDNVILRGLSADHTGDPDSGGHGIKLNGASFYIDIPASTILEQNNTHPLIYVGKGNTFDMLGSAALTGNYNAGISSGTDSEIADSKIGGAVRVAGGIFSMTGDGTSVHHNYAARYGGGVYSIGVGGTPAQISMKGENAEVSFNAAGTDIAGAGGGIVADGSDSDANQASIFKMSGNHATIRGNQGRAGGGIQVCGTGSTGRMSGTHAAISGNYSPTNGGGLRVAGYAEFTMSGANSQISGNTADDAGGGVDVMSGATFIMSGANALISGNTSAGNGGGVLCFNGDLTLEGGEISGNTSNGDEHLHQFGGDNGTHEFADGVHGMVTGTSGEGNDWDAPTGGLFSGGNWYGNQTVDTVIRVVR
jgi:hypothetical protein